MHLVLPDVEQAHARALLPAPRCRHLCRFQSGPKGCRMRCMPRSLAMGTHQLALQLCSPRPARPPSECARRSATTWDPRSLSEWRLPWRACTPRYATASATRSCSHWYKKLLPAAGRHARRPTRHPPGYCTACERSRRRCLYCLELVRPAPHRRGCRCGRSGSCPSSPPAPLHAVRQNQSKSRRRRSVFLRASFFFESSRRSLPALMLRSSSSRTQQPGRQESRREGRPQLLRGRHGAGGTLVV